MFDSRYEIVIGDKSVRVNKDVYEYVASLLCKIYELEKGINLIVEPGKLEPAVGMFCSDCKYVHKDILGNILGCKIHSLCENYEKREREN